MRIYRDKRFWLLIVALSMGGLAAWGAHDFLSDQAALLEEKHRSEMRAIIVASTDISPGTDLSPNNLAVHQMPNEWVSSGVVLPNEFERVEGKTVAYVIRRGEPLMWGHIQQKPIDIGFAQKLTEGRRAVTISVDEVSSVAGLIKPNDLIDLYVSFDYRRQRITAPLLQRVSVLATGQQTDVVVGPEHMQGSTYNTLTLDTNPDEAARLIVARQQAMITAILRSKDDDGTVTKQQAPSLASYYGLQVSPPPKTNNKVTVIYGERPPRTIPKLSIAEETNEVSAPSDLTMQQEALEWLLKQGDLDEKNP